MRTFPASDKQVAFIEKLVAERVYEGQVKLAELNSLDASLLIKMLLSAPHKGTPSRPNTIAEGLTGGIYLTEGGVYRAELSEQGRLYARHLNPAGGWTYERGAIFRLSPSQRMTLEQAKEMGVKFGVCVVCGRTLSDAESVQNGIGPICAKNPKFF